MDAVVSRCMGERTLGVQALAPQGIRCTLTGVTLPGDAVPGVSLQVAGQRPWWGRTDARGQQAAPRSGPCRLRAVGRGAGRAGWETGGPPVTLSPPGSRGIGVPLPSAGNALAMRGLSGLPQRAPRDCPPSWHAARRGCRGLDRPAAPAARAARTTGVRLEAAHPGSAPLGCGAKAQGPGPLGMSVARGRDARPMRAHLRDWTATAWEYAQLAAGATAMGFGISALIVPAHLGDGGLTGVAIILHDLTHLNVGPLYLALNIPLLAWAWIGQGLRFLWRTLVGVVLVSLATTLFAGVHLPVDNRLLSALYGGLLVGGGIGLMLRVDASSGGTDILARHLYRSVGWTYTQTYLVSDLLVLVGVAIWVGLPAAMYAWIATNVSGRAVSYVVEGPRQGRLALIVSAANERLAARVDRELERGATHLNARGAYRGEDRTVLMVAMGPRQVAPLRRLVAEEDPRAFVVVLPASEVLGEGFFGLESEGRVAAPPPP